MKDEMDFEMYGAAWIYRVISVVINLFRGKYWTNKGTIKLDLFCLNWNMFIVRLATELPNKLCCQIVH